MRDFVTPLEVGRGKGLRVGGDRSVSSPCKGEETGEGPYTARDSFRARFKILRPSLPCRFSFGLFLLASVSVAITRYDNDCDLGAEFSACFALWMGAVSAFRERCLSA